MFELYLTEHLFGSMISITKEQMFALGMVSIMTKTMSNIFMELGILIIFVIAGAFWEAILQMYHRSECESVDNILVKQAYCS